jgi:hypothetical protein
VWDHRPDVIGRRPPGHENALTRDEYAGRDAGDGSTYSRSPKMTGVDVGNSTGVEDSFECF